MSTGTEFMNGSCVKIGLLCNLSKIRNKKFIIVFTKFLVRVL